MGHLPSCCTLMRKKGKLIRKKPAVSMKLEAGCWQAYGSHSQKSCLFSFKGFAQLGRNDACGQSFMCPLSSSSFLRVAQLHLPACSRCQKCGGLIWCIGFFAPSFSKLGCGSPSAKNVETGCLSRESKSLPCGNSKRDITELQADY